MNRKVKKIFVLILIFLFFLIGPGAILYSQGYRFDLRKKRIVQTGGLFFKVRPPAVKIYLNGKLKKTTSILSSTALIENLLPKQYSVEIKKEGYHPWQKNLEVKEKWVTEAKNIILFPRNPGFSFLQKPIKNFWPSPDNKKMVYEKDRFLELLDLEKNKTRALFEKGLTEEILEIKWSPDSSQILLKIAAEEKLNYFVLRLNGEFVPISLRFLGENIKDLSFHPEQSSRIFFLKKNILFGIDYLEKTSKPILDNVITYLVLNRDLIWLDSRGFLCRSDLSGRVLEILNLKPIEVIPETKYQIWGQNLAKIFLEQSNTIFFLDSESRSFIKIFDNIKGLKFSPNSKSVVYFSENEIWIYFLEAEVGQPQREAGQNLFLLRFSEKIGNLFWLTDHYLIFNVGDMIKISEIDDRDRINIIDLAEFRDPEIFFSQANKKLYVLSNQDLFVSEKLVP